MNRFALDSGVRISDNDLVNTPWLASRKVVYTEFLTQLAVAWFAGGIIAPIVAPTATTSAGFTPTILSLAASFLSLRLAVLVQKERV